MKKSIKILICVIVLIVGVILGYRVYLIYGKYKITSDYNKTVGEVRIESGQSCDFSISNYSFCLPEEFVLDEEHTVDEAMYVYHDSNDRSINFADINEDLRRGTTGLYGKGMYTNEDKLILMCAASRGDVNRIKIIAKKIDQHAFIIITNSREVVGLGFKKE